MSDNILIFRIYLNKQTLLSMLKKIIVPVLFGIFCFVSNQIFSQNSVLSSGVWYKIAVAQDGIYCITRSDLSALGINVGVIDPRKISIYGNKAGMLPLKNNATHADDLKELSIIVKGEADGVFDPADTIFFYGQSQNEKIPDLTSHRFTQRQNIYSDSTFYFLTVSSTFGKRIQDRAGLPAFTNSTSTYTDFAWHELDSVNFLHTGKAWYGEMFDNQNLSTRNFNFDVSHINAGSSLSITTEIAGRNFLSGSSTFNIWSNGISSTKNISSVGFGYNYPYAIISVDSLLILPPVSNGIINCSWQSTDTASQAFLNKIELNFISNLERYRSQQLFSDLNSVGSGNITKYTISNATASTRIWNVSDPVNVFNQLYNSAFPIIDFNAENDSVHTYIAFDGHSFLKPNFVGLVSNQNLHSITQANYIVVTSEAFFNQATILANYHQTNDGLQSVVVTANQIYNEYSSGAQDPVAIRDFIRQVFNQSAANNDSLKYVLFFGSGSYDFKGKLGSISSFVPTYQSDLSLVQIQSSNSDEFFTYMNDTASDDWHNRVEVAIGRIPVRNISESYVINKIISYNNVNTLGSWRKRITLIADDGAQNIFFKQVDTLANRLDNNYCEYDIRKIYVDSYIRDTTGGRFSYPGVVSDIQNSIQNGTLIIHYTGYGGSIGWAHEIILDTVFLHNVINFNNLPLFLSATAAFNRFDDPLKTSGGQIVSLNNSNIGIASISSSRISFSSTDNNFYRALHSHLFGKENNHHLRIGDLFKKAKQDYRDPYSLAYCLLGDPATKLNYPENAVVTTAINGITVSSQADTLLPGQAIQVDGEIHDDAGNIISSFNGMVDILVFGPKQQHFTLANDSFESLVAPFYSWDDTLSYLNVPVSNGFFSASFYLPYDIDSGFRQGKISFYAKNGITDASGCYLNIIYKNLTPGIEEINDISVSVSPNPANERIEINLRGITVNGYSISVFDINGKVVGKFKINANHFVLERNHLAAGEYIFEILNQKSIAVKRGKFLFR